MPAMAPTRRSRIVPVEDALEELRAGRMIVLMDDDDRENEGDLCVAAERVTAEHINFMATYGRGLICLALTEERCEQLGLAMMTRENRAPLGPAFTVSIDARHDLKIVTIASLIEYRIRRDSLVHRVAEAPLETRAGGEFRALVYTTDIDDSEHLVLVKGAIRPEEPVLVRPHIEYLPGDVFGYRDRDTRGLLHRAMARIAAEGRGVILYLRRPDRFDLVTAGAAAGTPPSTGDPGLPRSSTFREFGIGAQILRDICVGKIRWLTNTPLRLVSLPGYGREIVEYVPLAAAGETAPASEPHAGRLRTRR